jgi:hypothetical protein
MFHNWISSLHPLSGCLVLEKQSSSGSVATTSDPFAASDDDLIALIDDVSRQSSLGCSYVGALALKYVPSSIIQQAGHPLIAGTATTLTELEDGKAYLTDFSNPPRPRPLRHHIFIRTPSESKLMEARQLVANINSLFDSKDPSSLQAFLSVHPSSLREISFREDILNKVVASYLLATALKKDVFKDTRGDQPHERNDLEDDVERALACGA